MNFRAYNGEKVGYRGREQEGTRPTEQRGNAGPERQIGDYVIVPFSSLSSLVDPRECTTERSPKNYLTT